MVVSQTAGVVSLVCLRVAACGRRAGVSPGRGCSQSVASGWGQASWSIGLTMRVGAQVGRRSASGKLLAVIFPHRFRGHESEAPTSPEKRVGHAGCAEAGPSAALLQKPKLACLCQGPLGSLVHQVNSGSDTRRVGPCARTGRLGPCSGSRNQAALPLQGCLRITVGAGRASWRRH